VVAEDLLSDAGQEIQNSFGVLLQAGLLEKIIFCSEFQQHRQTFKGTLSETAKCVQTMASTEQEKLQRILQQCTARSMMWGFV